MSRHTACCVGMALFFGAALPALSASWSLEEFPLVLIKQDSGEPRIGLCMDGRPMKMGGKTFTHGIGSHAKSEIIIRLDGKAQELTAMAGMSEYQKGTEAKVDFVVEGDGKTLWSSGGMTPADKPRPVSVKLEGIHLLVLRIGDGGNGNAYDHANWADASIRYAGEAPGPDAIIFNATTKDIQIKYLVRKDKSLEILQVAAREGKWRAPLGGPLFPGNPWRDGNGPRYCGPAAIVCANGDTALEPLYESHSSKQESQGIEHLTIFLRDRVNPIDIEMHLRIYSAENIIEQWHVLKNGMDKPINVPRLDSLYWQARLKDAVYLEWFESQEGNEAGQPKREKLAQGCRVLESRDGNRHKSGPVPAFALGFGDFPDEDTVPCLVAALSWSANTKLSFEINNKTILETSVGVSQPGQPTVDPGQSLITPVCVYSFSSAGKGQASRNFHRWVRRYGMRDGNRLRPVDNNSWEGCGMNVSEGAILEMMKMSADLGIELYVLDDGWFGDSRNLGDWWINPKLFPNGLRKCIDEGKKMGIDFGIWFEPEMLNEGSKLFKEHPEWVMKNPGREFARQRNQVTLDVANPALQEFMFKTVNDLLKENPEIRFVKWDCNSNINNPYSPFLGSGHQGDMLNCYMSGFYGVMERLVSAYPGIDFQACAAGGGRADLGALRFGHTYWPSDNTNPNYRLGAVWNFSLCLPVMAAACHVTHAGGEFKSKFRFDVAMMGQLGMEVDPRKSEPEYLKAAKAGIATYKTVRDIVQLGDVYRFKHPFDSSTPSLNFVSPNQRRALVLAYQTGEIKTPLEFRAPVKGLEPLKKYQVKEINLPPGDEVPRLSASTAMIQTGAEWMNQGVPLIFTRKFDSAAVTLDLAEKLYLKD
jgi:alpha-galactosidase